MYIGSGDVNAILAGIKTKTYQIFFARFCSGEVPYYNAKLSPIDACRTGAILEERYLLSLPDNYFPQYKVTSKEMDVFKASLDYGEVVVGKLKNAIEFKTIWFEDFVSIEMDLEYIKKKFKKYYIQIQEQLYCSELKEITLKFCPVYTYDDKINNNRIIDESELKCIVIKRDNKIIEKIKERGVFFQSIKNHFKE